MRIRRLRKHPAGLDVTAFINLIVVLVPFLLSTAVFTRLAVLELTLPAQTSGVEKLDADNPLKLEIIIFADAIEVGDKIGGRFARFEKTDKGYDVHALAPLLTEVKAKWPQTTEATVLAQPDTPYDVLVQVMDEVRAGHSARGAEVVRTELFPNISIGDAPMRPRASGS